MTGICGACYNNHNGICELHGFEVAFDDNLDCRDFGMSSIARKILIEHKKEFKND